MTKPIEDSFRDWESDVFGFGYGSGEPHILPALRRFLELCPAQGCYEYLELERELTPAVAWLLICALCRAGILEYGTSPRGAWLTQEGKALRAFVLSKSADELVDLACDFDPDRIGCMPNACNCGPNGYERGRVCLNPFWQPRRSR